MSTENTPSESEDAKPRGEVGRRAFFREMFGGVPEKDQELVEETEEDSELIGGPLSLKDIGEDDLKDKLPVERRGFFKDVFRSLMEPAVDYIEEKLEPFVPMGDYTPERFLRPPGAQYEHIFVNQCERNGKCVEVCPVQAIQVMVSDDPALDGTPFIVPTEQACVVCDGLECMKACPSGALELIPKEEIRMGIACMRYEDCLRTHGEDCQVCVDFCPIGSDALIIHDGRVEVMVNGCVGCGVCEHLCPSMPKAIFVEPV